MTFNFKKEYEQLSNEELLKIIRQPDQYQAEAIEAAQEILDSREVPDEDINKVDRHFYNKEAELQAIITSKNAVKEYVSLKLEYLINPIKHPNEKFSPLHWLSYLIIIETIYYLISVPGTINSFGVFFGPYTTFDIYTILLIVSILVNLVYFPFKLYLFLKKSKWAWILFTFGALYGTTSYIQSILITLFFSPRYSIDLGGISTLTILYLALEVLLIFFLLKPDVYSYFNVQKSTKSSTLFISIIICILISIVPLFSM